jgi:hybrid polyketide synthase/nonribosomal peptide synthetase ACE1
MRVSHSFLKPVRFSRDASLFLSIGERIDTSEQVLSLSLSNAAVVRPEAFVKLNTLPTNSSPTNLLRLVSLYQISSLILGDSDEGARILVHDADPALQGSLRAEGRRRSIEVICTTTCDHVSSDPYQLHPNAPARSIRALQPDLITSFVDFGFTGEVQSVSQQILHHLNVACRRGTAKSIFGGFTRKLSKNSKEATQSILQNAISHASSCLSDTSTEDANIVLPEEVDNIDPGIAHRYIIDWGTEAEVEALVEPADTFPLFSKETTYWLVGLTGTLGCSLCQWMLRNGARYFVLTSRNPKIDRLAKDNGFSTGHYQSYFMVRPIFHNFFKPGQLLIKTPIVISLSCRTCRRRMKIYARACPPLEGYSKAAVSTHLIHLLWHVY